MGIKKKTKTAKRSKKSNKNELKKEIIMILIFVLTLLCGISIYTEKAGELGKIIKDFCVGLFGISAYILPIYIITLVILMLLEKLNKKIKFKYIIGLCIMILISILAHVINYTQPTLTGIDKMKEYFLTSTWKSGGMLGGILGDLFINLLGLYGTYVLLVALFIINMILFTERSFVNLILRINSKIENIYVSFKKQLKNNKKDELIVNGVDGNKKTENIKEDEKIETLPDESIKIMSFQQENQNNSNPKEDNKKTSVENYEKNIQEDIKSNTKNINYVFPSIELLNKNIQVQSEDLKSKIVSNAKSNARKLEKALESFGVKAKVVQVNKGPTVTRYELQPSQGVKVSKIVNLADDIALNLAASGIRIEAPVPGKGVVGIEVPNDQMLPVFLREVIEHINFKKFPSNVAFGLGKDIDGNVVVADIAKMPHLLIAGATGSGKSVCINSLIISIIYKAHPNDVKLILIDPKVVELSVYNGIPHLLIPVVNDPKKAAGALNWAVQEMITRYKKFADLNVRDIKGYNAVAEENPEVVGEKMPQIVVIIDELADLMMASPKEVEESICRLAQMARAAGINLVIATQRPSVDVITGVIKANIPSRLAFAVSSGTDSRTILDMNGAEKLLGKGDMLFMPIGVQKPTRIQGAFISDKEVEKIVDFIKKDVKVEYSENVMDEIASANCIMSNDKEVDEYLQKAIELVAEKQKASISMLQRVFRIGFNRAARLMEDMHDRGIVGPEEGSKPRKVLISKEQLESMKE